MNNETRYLLGGMMLLMPLLGAADEYIPPPTGPYQSTVIINEVEQNSPEKHQVYKFPQAELFEPRNIDPALPSSSNRGLAVDSLQSGSGSYYNPGAVMSGSSVTQQQGGAGGQAIQPFYDPSLYNNPWAESSSPQQPRYQGQWNYPNSSYGYYQYPYGGYSNQYNPQGAPYSSMPSPWSMMPTKPFSGK